MARPIMDYGSISLITAEPKTIKKLETLQTKYIRGAFNAPLMKNENTLKLANLPTIADRIKHLAHNWYQRTIKNNKEVQQFIRDNVRQLSRMKTPYSILNNTYKQK